MRRNEERNRSPCLRIIFPLEKKASRNWHALESRGQDPYLPVLAELVPKLNQLTQVPLGLVQIALDQIAGTATKGRTTAFSRSFLPLLEADSEFANKWATLYDGIIEDGLRQPIVALEYYNRFYIVEGNKRVSVMRRLDAVNIEADVTRVLPESEDSERYRIYQEFLSFYADTKINFIYFSHEGRFARLYELMGKTPGREMDAGRSVRLPVLLLSLPAGVCGAGRFAAAHARLRRAADLSGGLWLQRQRR